MIKIWMIYCPVWVLRWYATSVSVDSKLPNSWWVIPHIPMCSWPVIVVEFTVPLWTITHNRTTWYILTCLLHEGRNTRQSVSMPLMSIFCHFHWLLSCPSRHRRCRYEWCVPTTILVLPSGREGELWYGQQRYPVPRHWPWHCPVTEGTHNSSHLLRIQWSAKLFTD